MHLTLAALAAIAMSAAPSRLAIHPLSAQGTSPEAMQQLHAAVRIELSKIPTLAVAGENETRAALKQPCGQDHACLAALGKALGVQEVLFGEVRSLPDSFAVTLRLLDVSTGRESAAATESVNRDVEEMVWATRAQIARLKTPERYAGQLLVSGPAGSTVLVNGSAVSMEIPLVLRPGAHGVKVRHAGKETESWIDVRFEQTATAKLEPPRVSLAVTWAPWSPPAQIAFSPVAAPPFEKAGSPSFEPLALHGAEEPGTHQANIDGGWPRWPGWVAAAVGVGLLSGGVVQQVRAKSISDEIEAMRHGGQQLTPDQIGEVQAKVESRSSALTSGAILLGVGAAVGIGGGAYLLLAPGPQPAEAAVRVAGRF